MKNKIVQHAVDTTTMSYSDMPLDFQESVAGISEQLNSEAVKAVVIAGVEARIGTTTLAACLAEQESLYKKVLIVDCNLRSSKLSKRYSSALIPKNEQSDINGLTNYLVTKLDVADITYSISNNLDFIPVGTAADKAQVFLFSGAFAAKFAEIASAYDLVILDTADLASHNDALRLGGSLGNILLVVGRCSPRKRITKAFHSCDSAEVKVVGIVINSI